MRPLSKQYEMTASFRGHLNIFFRPIRPSDAVLLREFFHSHSEQTIYYRYFSPLRELSPEQVRKFVILDYQNDMALVGLTRFQGRDRMLCVGRYVRNSSGNDAEVAITIHDDYQRHGLGTFLLRALIKIAHEHGLSALTADVLADNHGMMRLLHKCSAHLKIDFKSGVYHVSLPLVDAKKDGLAPR
jgi:acetyltransferase